MPRHQDECIYGNRPVEDNQPMSSSGASKSMIAEIESKISEVFPEWFDKYSSDHGISRDQLRDFVYNLVYNYFR